MKINALLKTLSILKLEKDIKISKGAFMLILTRRVGEKIHLGNEITVTLLNVKGNQTQIGIDAPIEVAVHREEIYERIQREGKDHQKQKRRAYYDISD